MKKLFSLMLCLILLSACALAEEAPYTLDMGDFTMSLNPGDSVELLEKIENMPLLYVYPADTGDENYYDNINIVWNTQDVSAMTEADIEYLAEFVLTQSEQQYAAMGIDAANFQLLGTELEEGVKGSILYSFELDYSSLGADLVSTIYQYQVFVMDGAQGSYILTASSDSFDALSHMSLYLDSFQIK